MCVKMPKLFNEIKKNLLNFQNISLEGNIKKLMKQNENLETCA